MMAGARRPAASRSSKGANTAKMAATFAALVRVAPEKPTKVTACAIPGVSRAMREASRVTASVRSRLAPSGSWMLRIA